jgi:hypothetical protein
MVTLELLDEQVISQQGRFHRIRRWGRGAHPSRGTITRGWTGWETVEETEYIRPVLTFAVSAGQRAELRPEGHGG